MYFYSSFLITPFHKKVKEEVDYLRNRTEKLQQIKSSHGAIHKSHSHIFYQGRGLKF